MSGVNSGTLEIESLKTLIEVTSLVNSNYSDFDALLVCILESAMRLVSCELSSLSLSNQTNTEINFTIFLSSSGIKVIRDSASSLNSPTDWVYRNNKALILDNVSPDNRFFPTIQEQTVSVLAVPMRVKDSCIGVIQLVNKWNGRSFNQFDLEALELFSSQVGLAYEIASKFKLVQNENRMLLDSINYSEEYTPFLAYSPVMLDLINTLDEVAQTDVSVLIFGESGVGKGLIARQIHQKSNRASKPFVQVNCTTLSPLLLESKLFGHVKGAFANATRDEVGSLEFANGGTVFLDEVGHLSLDLQSKLLEVFQSKSFTRIGAGKKQTVDVRIIAATNCDLEYLVQEGKFRKDLFYRLNLLPLTVPPLRNRKEDIEPLALFFCKKFSSEVKRKFLDLSDEAKRALYSYYWPGNVRELKNTIERACILGKPPVIRLSDLRLNQVESCYEGQKGSLPAVNEYDFNSGDKTLKTAVNKFKRDYITRILDETSWNQTEASKILGIQRTYVSRLLNELHIR